MQKAPRTVRIVGLGSPDAGDDQLGLLAARRLRPLLPPTVEIGEDTTGGARLTEWCEGADSLFVIDAASATPEWPSGSHLRLAFPTDAARLITTGLRGTHSLSLPEALRLAEVLDILPRQVIIHTLAAEHFELGTPLSRTLQIPLGQLIEAVRAEAKLSCVAEDTNLVADGRSQGGVKP